MLEQVSTQTAASQGAQHKADWEVAVARAEKAERELAEMKAKILVPTAQLALERNVTTMNGRLVLSLREQLNEVAAQKHELERQLEEAKASNTQMAPRTEPESETESRLVPLKALIEAEQYGLSKALWLMCRQGCCLLRGVGASYVHSPHGARILQAPRLHMCKPGHQAR
jgi:uncharacterized membrane protein YgaE (UPF0421/DUF939 family)